MSGRLTEWFPADVVPALPGWYSREYDGELLQKAHDYWDGENWFIGDGRNARLITYVSRRWRGLAEGPSAPKGKA